MLYYTIPPPPQLVPYIKCFWVYEGKASSAAPFVHRSYADGCAEIVFHYQGAFAQVFSDQSVARSWSSGLHAQSTGFTRFVTEQDFRMFGVYLYPFTIPALLRITASDLTGQLPDLNELFGKAGRELEERIMLAIDNRERTRIVSAFLISLLARTKREIPPVFASIGEIIRAQGLVKVGALANRYAYSPRNFERKFKEFAGLTPKLFSRIVRFQSIVKTYRKTDRSLTEIAHDFGYYDQSHFIHEFKEFSGYNPKAFFAGGAEGADYLGA